jgi:long-subunit acyl-CoA synthetase (AMP-forming)
LQRARPTALFGVPRFWTKFLMGVYSKIPEKRLDFLLGLPFIGKRVGHKVLAGLGLDALRIALSGAAPVPQTLLRWYQKLGLDVLEVYGMTESCGYSHIGLPGQNKPGWIGKPCPEVEVRIEPSGEVLVRSGATMLGYFKEPEKTAEAITEDGFLRTGDKGEEDAEGNLRLTGRLKEIFKTSKGKYVAPAPIENRLAVHARIEQVCVVGDGLSAPLGLCVLSAVGQQDAKGSARAGLHSSLEKLLEEVNGVLDRHERLRRLVVVKDSWAVENGFLTPTLKIKRNMIEAAYGARFAEWSERSEAVLWQD